MKSNQNIILIASITAVLGFGILAFQTDNISAYGLMDNSSEILDLEEKGEITTLAKKEGAGKKTPTLKADETFLDLDTRIKCSLSSILSCTVTNSGDGLNQVALGKFMGSTINCDKKDVRDGATRATVDTRKSDKTVCDFPESFEYRLDVMLFDRSTVIFSVTPGIDSLIIAPVVNN